MINIELNTPEVDAILDALKSRKYELELEMATTKKSRIKASIRNSMLRGTQSSIDQIGNIQTKLVEIRYNRRVK